jgi:hypothetical protein
MQDIERIILTTEANGSASRAFVVESTVAWQAANLGHVRSVRFDLLFRTEQRSFDVAWAPLTLRKPPSG